jgi:hypothetical protein
VVQLAVPADRLASDGAGALDHAPRVAGTAAPSIGTGTPSTDPAADDALVTVAGLGMAGETQVRRAWLESLTRSTDGTRGEPRAQPPVAALPWRPAIPTPARCLPSRATPDVGGCGRPRRSHIGHLRRSSSWSGPATADAGFLAARPARCPATWTMFGPGRPARPRQATSCACADVTTESNNRFAGGCASSRTPRSPGPTPPGDSAPPCPSTSSSSTNATTLARIRRPGQAVCLPGAAAHHQRTSSGSCGPPGRTSCPTTSPGVDVTDGEAGARPSP